jgi:hypothetical protein
LLINKCNKCTVNDPLKLIQILAVLLHLLANDSLGLSGLKVWARQREEDPKHWQLPPEEKESYSWLEIAEQANWNRGKI